jgi:DNA polymerase, archaea type
MAGIVAAALDSDTSIEIYQRNGGSVSRHRFEFQPWLIVSERLVRTVRSNPSTVETLKGGASLNSLLTFDSWPRWRSAYQALREDPGASVLAFPNPVEQFMISTGLKQFEGIEFDQVKRAQLDIETTGLDPTADDARIIMIAVAINGHNPQVLRSDELAESEMLTALEDWLRENDPDVIEGHNIFNFDIPYLVLRARAHNRALNWGRDGSALRQTGSRRFKAGARSIPFESAYVRGRHIIDTYQQIQRYDYAGMLHSYGLKQSIEALGLSRPDRTHVTGAEILKIWRDDPGRIVEYAIDDLRDTDELSRLSLPTEFYQARILPSLLQDVATGGPGEKVNDLLVRAYVARKESVPAPRSPRSYPGGYTEVRRVGIFSPVVKCDVESLYPAIMLSDGIAPSSDRLHVFLPLLQTLTTERLEAKRRAATTTGHERARWEGLQSSLKVLINSFYGYLGYSRGYFNDFDAAERVTIRGHKIIRQVTDSLEEQGALTIEIDTDGVYFEPPAGLASGDDEERLISAISETLDSGINLAHDGRWQAMLSLRLKNYVRRNGSGGRIRTSDLWVMSPTSCHCSTPRCLSEGSGGGNEWPVLTPGVRAAASPPTQLPAQYSPALPWGTTRFGMETGWFHGALGHAHTRVHHSLDICS